MATRSHPVLSRTTVYAHEHEWHLASVEFDDGVSVRSFECAGCPDVLYQ